MQLWLAVKNVLPLHRVPVQPGRESNRSDTEFANDVLLETSTFIPLTTSKATTIPPWGQWLRGAAAGIKTRIGNHTFRATGITAYLKNSGKLEHAQAMANHSSPRTTKLYDRREEEISLDEVERIAI